MRGWIECVLTSNYAKHMLDAMWERRLNLFGEAFMHTFTPEECRKNWLNWDEDPKSNLLMQTLNKSRRIVS